MELRRELLLTVGTLVTLNLLLAFGAIGLFVRMGPAIEGILKDNVVSIVAAEQVLMQLAMADPGPLRPDAVQVLEDAVQRIEANVTEEAEKPVVQSVRGSLAAVGEGDAEARALLVDAASRLIRINREAMHRVDEEARRLGSAGAWAAVLISFVSFLLSLLLVVRLQNRLVRPLLDLYQVLEAARRGNRMRRCRMSDAPREVRQVTHSVNGLLDERLHAH